MVTIIEEIRQDFIGWVQHAERDAWTNHCLAVWLYQLGGLAAEW